jgi:transposase
MIQFPANANILIMHDAVSFRNGIDGTAAIVRVILQRQPMDGAFFVFRNKMGHSLRVLYYDSTGFWLCTKRLSKGTFNGVWPKGDGTSPGSSLLARELQILIWGGNPMSCAFPEVWRRVG